MVMDNKNMNAEVDKSQVADLSGPEKNPTKRKQKLKNRKKKKQKVSESQVIPSPCLAKLDLRKAMEKQNDVAILLAAKVISTVARNSNFVFSPAAINAVLIMAANSPGEESLRSFILSFLRSSSTDELNAVFGEICSVVLADGSASGGPKIAAVNGVWIDQSQPFNSSWKDLLVNCFKANFAQVDFRSKAEIVRKDVNSWASRHTNNLINDFLPPGSVNCLTDWIYGNALYFKGVWKDKFNKSLTRNKRFHLLNGESVLVPFMISHENQLVKEYDGFKVLKLPYQHGRDDTNRRFSMYFYLPDKKDGLDNLLERISSTHGFLDSHIPDPMNRYVVGKFRIPKFEIEFGFEAKEVFEELDVSLHHKAFIKVDEEGTEAVAFTSMRGGYSGPPIDFVADHPFLFLIREDKSGTVLFVGQIFDPSKSSSA